MIPARGPRAHAVAIAVAATVLLSATPVRAQHEHHHGGPPASDGEPAPRGPGRFEVSLAMIGARFEQPLYVGDYAGLALGVGWRHGRIGVHAALPAYHLRKNGAAVDGVGDAMVGVDVAAYQRGRLSAGAALAITLPTGAALTGLGMGHPMLMPGLWLTRDGAQASVGVSAGWCGSLGTDPAHHEHGAWPLVEPMTASELMADVHGDARVHGRLRASARVAIAVPLQGAANRAVGALGAAWRGRRADTGAELQAGLAGDPFTVRALLTTALRF